jgi:diguanylate cyclase (GGDEF)-like protein
MRIVQRSDAALIVALTFALLTTVWQPFSILLNYLRGAEQGTGLYLAPALAILITGFGFHQWRKRQEFQANSRISDAAAKAATNRVAEMELLVGFGHALAHALDEDAIRDVIISQGQQLIPWRSLWVMLVDPPEPQAHPDAEWRTLAAIGDSTVEERERAARRAFEKTELTSSAPGDFVCFPMIIAGRPIGVLGVSSSPPVNEYGRNLLAAAAALLAVSLKNADLFREVKENSVRDPLTGCYLRAHALEILQGELRHAYRSQSPVSTIMFDLDSFKAINDTHGHLAGDAVLAAVGACMQTVLRASDCKCRYGGEEFLVVLPGTPLDGAVRVAEGLRRELEQHSVPWGQGEIRISASFGVATSLPGEVHALTLLARADAALYGAKQSGRNCVRVGEAPPRSSGTQSTVPV